LPFRNFQTCNPSRGPFSRGANTSCGRFWLSRPFADPEQDAEANAKNAVDREAEIATGNPLLNLQAALGQTPGTPGTLGSTATSTATFAVKRRWDDDLIFKNQAAGIDDKPKKGEFVNDLLRSEFHKKFMLK
jgi:protein CWC15